MTASDFVAGLPLRYKSGDLRCELLYRAENGVLYLTVNGKEDKIENIDDVQARRVFYNLIGGKKND